MYRTIQRLLGLTCAIILCVTLCSCGNQLKSTGGTSLPAFKESDYDFGASYVSKRTDISTFYDDWRVGSLGSNSVKITSGTSGVGARYVEKLPDKYIARTVISFEDVSGAVKAAVGFGTETGEMLTSLSIERNPEGAVTLVFSSGNQIMCRTDTRKIKDTVYTVILDNSYGDNTFHIHVQGNDGTTLDVQTDPIPQETIKQASSFLFFADQSNVIFDGIAVDIMIYQPGDLLEYAKIAYKDLIDNYTIGDEDTGRYYKTYSCLWGWGMGILPMETMYEASGDEQILKNFQAQWKNIQDTYRDEDLTAPGIENGAYVNPAHDDAAWTAMTLMSMYRMTGDEKALDLAAETVRRSYEYWKDGSVSNGLWYRYWENRNMKSVYCAGLLLSALEYHELTKGTEKADPNLYEETLKLYEWVEEKLRREDNLYYCDYYDNKETGESYPAGIEAPDHITENGSCSALFGNTGMAAVNAKLYKLTGDKKYKDRAVATANALLVTPYNDNGVLLNDRDAFTDAAFMRYFVNDVLTLDGVDSKVATLLKNTALSIMYRCRTEEGYYAPRWGTGETYNTPDQQVDRLEVSATTIHMVIAAALAEKLELMQ